jgi:hypothetical protein
MTATSWPSPRENCHAPGRFSVAWLAVGASGSLPGMTPETLHGPRCSIGCTGPGVPAGGCAAGSIAGGLIAIAGAQVHITTATTAVRQPNPTARFID